MILGLAAGEGNAEHSKTRDHVAPEDVPEVLAAIH